MKIPKILLFIGFCFVAFITNAQTARIEGSITDTLNKQNLNHAVIMLLHSKDSIICQSTRTNEKGNFELHNLPAGNYILLITYPLYADYTDNILLTDSSHVSLNNIPLITKAHLLQEVIVKQTIGAIKLKGDTTEYKADSFHLQANANVEDLLKRLPGIQVDKNGQITAQGEKVQKVLVDGEEFFGDDPTLVTQNIRADMVDKVQVFDKKSDQATFTGIDDGQKTKTINLKLKDDKKKGYFGKISAGAGTDGYHDNQVMFNKFRKKQKIAGFGIISNTGKTGLNWQDQNSFGDAGSGLIIMDDGGMMISNEDDITGWGGNYNGQGKPLVQTGGLHYNNKWNDDKQSLNANYKILQLQVDGSSTTNTENILPDTLYYTNQTQHFDNKVLRNKLSGTYEIQLDSSSSIKAMVDGTLEHKTTANYYNTESLTKNSSLVNSGNRSITADGDNNSLNTDILWRKKFKKKGRTLSVDFKENYFLKTSSGKLYAKNDFYSSGSSIPSSSQITDQYKSSNNKTLAFDGKFVYTEPLSSASSLVANYELIVNNSASNRSSFNKGTTGKYDVLDTLYSNDYSFNVLTNKTGLSYSFINKKIRLNLGNTIGITRFDQDDHVSNISTDRNFVNWYPQSNFSYAFTSQRRLSVNYSGSTAQPSLQQIQPVRTNDDPLNITIGNAALKPSFTNAFNLNFYDSKPLTNQFVSIGTNYRFTEDAFSNNNTVDSLGRRVSQTINVNGNYSLSGYLNYYFKLKKPELRLGLNGNVNTNKNTNIVNGFDNITKSENYSFGIYAGKEKEKKYDNSITANATYTTSNSSVQSNISTHYWTFNIRPDIDFFLPLKLQIHSDCDFIYRQKTSTFDNDNNVIIWNLWLGKKLLKNDALLIKVSGNDLLNQNIGFNRTVNTNFISQNTYTTIQRYFMLSLVWNFNKNGPKQNAN